MKRISLLMIAIVSSHAADAIYPRTPESPTADTIVIKGTLLGVPGNGEVRIGSGTVSAKGQVNAVANMNAAGYGLNAVGTASGDYRALGRTAASAIVLRSYSSNEGGNGNLVLASADNNGIYDYFTVLGGNAPFGIFQGNDPGTPPDPGQVRIGGGVVRARGGVVIGVDPGGSESLRVNGGVRTTGNIIMDNSGPVLLMNNNNAAVTDATFFNWVSLQRAGVEKGWLGFGDGTNGLMRVTNTIGDLDLKTVSSGSFVTVSGGRFSIGENGRIQVADGSSTATDARWLFRNGTDTHAALRVIANSPTFLTIDAAQANNSAVAKDLYVNPNGGNVVLGTGPGPVTNKLTVYGTISAKEIKVTTTGADYVFADGYQLRPLAEVEQFIAREKRLPEMMSAKEMQTDGMPVSEVVTKQLAKIEELTLYAILAQKERDAAKAETRDQVAKLEARIQRLEALIQRQVVPTSP